MPFSDMLAAVRYKIGDSACDLLGQVRRGNSIGGELTCQSLTCQGVKIYGKRGRHGGSALALRYEGGYDS